MLLERNPEHVDVDAIPAAHWHLGDACELSLLEAVHLEDYDVVVAATGDDKANVVVSLLAKTEFAVPRVVARVNDPRNEWLFDDAWGVDVAVPNPGVPRDPAWVTILRGAGVTVPEPDEPLEGGDELLFVATTEVEDELR